VLARKACSRYLASNHVDCCQEGGPPMTFVVMDHRTGTPLLQRRPWPGPVRGLALASPTGEENGDSLWKAHPKPYHISQGSQHVATGRGLVGTNPPRGPELMGHRGPRPSSARALPGGRPHRSRSRNGPTVPQAANSIRPKREADADVYTFSKGAIMPHPHVPGSAGTAMGAHPTPGVRRARRV
jgi:hypothetical protein